MNDTKITTIPTEMLFLTEERSSTASRLTYDRFLRVLTVQYRQATKGDGTSVYQYPEISLEEWDRLCLEERPATWIKRNIVIKKRTTIRRPGVTWCEACGEFRLIGPTHAHDDSRPKLPLHAFDPSDAGAGEALQAMGADALERTETSHGPEYLRTTALEGFVMVEQFGNDPPELMRRSIFPAEPVVRRGACHNEASAAYRARRAYGA